MKTALFLLILVLTTYAQFDSTYIAVNDLKCTGISDKDRDLISNRLRTELFKTGAFRVMERSEMMAIAEEQEFQKSAFCEKSDCVVDFGRILGVNSIIAGTVGRVDRFYTVSIQLISVETGEVLSVADYDYTGTVTGLISEGMAVVAKELTARNIHGEKVPLTLSSKPARATVEIDKSVAGTTPYKDSLGVGTYTVIVSKNGFEPVETEITLRSGEPFSHLFTLEKEKSRAGVITRIITGATAAGAVVLGIYANNKMDEYSSDAHTLLAQAMLAEDGTAFNANYMSAISDAQRMQTIRNVSYSLAGASVVLFGVSFLF